MKPLYLLLLVPTVAFARPIARPITVVRSTDFHPNPNFRPVFKHALNGAMGAVEQEGEIAILEGDDDLVSTDATGYGVVFDNRAQNPIEITNRFYTRYGDDFDEIVIFTTFDDNGAAGALAYFIASQQDISGIGQQLFDDSSGWGSAGHLHGFVNMMRWDQLDFPTVPITDPKSQLYNTMGQEFAHRWLAFMPYKDANGTSSLGMLGRDQAHWASTLSADGSLIDGNRLIVNADGSFTTADLMTRYWSLDLYGMGLGPASDVEPFFLLHDAVTSRGRKVDPTQYLQNNARITGSREDITVEQVIAANGPRVPAWDKSPHDFRIAFALLTAPTERASDVREIAHTLDQVRKVWEERFSTYTGGKGRVCTQISSPCDTAAARVRDGQISEAGGNHNGVAEPGEPVAIKFDLYNDSALDAKQVHVHAAGALVGQSGADTQVDDLPPAAAQEITFTGSVPANAPCGTPITIEVESVVGSYTFRGFAEVLPGVSDALKASFEDGRNGFVANPKGVDSTTYNGWQYGTPIMYRGQQGWIFQPNGCHDNSNKCWFTGLKKGTRGTNLSSLGVGESHLLSHDIDMRGAYLPSIHYFAWFQALDFTNPMGGVPDPNVSLVLEGSADGGNSWVVLDTLSDSQPKWQERSVDLAPMMMSGGADPAAMPLVIGDSLILRFTASNPIATDIVEAGLDDVQVLAQTPACNPNQPVVVPLHKSHGCDVGGSSSGAGVAGLVLAALWLASRRLRRPA